MNCFGITLFTVLLIFREVFTAPDVFLDRGILKGMDENAVTTQKPYHVYYGIPFAQPPLGSLRFKPPQPFYARDPRQTINSNNYRPACLQSQALRAGINSVSEDCLYLNVFTPSVDVNGSFDPGRGKKVMFWIHGGGFISGSAIMYRPSQLVTDFDVIVVTTQYRLGPFGFLSSGDDVLPGNLGLRDQILALQWVNDNIRLFGGDPDDVTIFGESAGGISVSALALSPLSKGLFTKAIMQSGTVLAPGGIKTTPEDIFYKVAKNAKCLPTFFIPGFGQFDNQRIVDCLEKLPARDLQNADSVLDLESPLKILDLKAVSTYAPNVDGYLLPKDPASLLLDKQYMKAIGALDRKHVIGFNNNEGIFFYFLLKINGFNEQVLQTEDVMKEAISTNVKSIFPFPVTSDILNFVNLIYTYPREWDGKPRLQGLLDLMTDTAYVIPSIKYARALSSLSSEVDVYLYLFDHYPELKNPDSPFKGSSHTVDIYYLFDENAMFPSNNQNYANFYTSSSLPLFDIFRGMFANIARSGNLSLPGNIAWPRFDLVNQNYMAVSVKPEVRSRVYKRRVSLWLDFLPKVVGIIFSQGPGQSSLKI